jgi:hypothetical protein
VEIDWWRFRSSWSRIKRVRGAMVKTIFHEILMHALCSANSSKVLQISHVLGGRKETSAHHLANWNVHKRDWKPTEPRIYQHLICILDHRVACCKLSYVIFLIQNSIP